MKCGEEVIEVQKNERFTIELDSNPTTGYRWEANYDKNSIELIRQRFELSSERIGAGGKEKFDFIALRNGETKMDMTYKRSWEDRPIETKSFIVRIR